MDDRRLDFVRAYTGVLFGLGLDADAVWDVVSALLARDFESGWWRSEC